MHVVSVGGGLSSTMALPERVVREHGRDACEFVMAALPNEDPDVWRLVEAVEGWLGIAVQRIGLNLTPWDVFFGERMMGSSRVDPCSRILKREVLQRYMAENHDPANTVLHVGITYHEIDRMAAIRANWTRKGWRVEAPLSSDPTLTRERMVTECRMRFGFVPRLYDLGFTHNNCGGACIKAGHKEWARLLWHLPDRYEWWESNERRFRQEVGTRATILRDRRGGISTPLSLVEFRERMQARWASMLPGIDPFEGLDPTPACAFCEAA